MMVGRLVVEMQPMKIVEPLDPVMQCRMVVSRSCQEVYMQTQGRSGRLFGTPSIGCERKMDARVARMRVFKDLDS